jgi:hypothetical protein
MNNFFTGNLLTHTPPPPQRTHISIFFQLGWVLHPIYSATGDYPPVMKEWLAKKSKEEGYSRSRLPSFTKEEIEMVKGEFPLTATSDVTKK